MGQTIYTISNQVIKHPFLRVTLLLTLLIVKHQQGFSQKIMTDRYANDIFLFYEAKSYQLSSSFAGEGPNMALTYTIPLRSVFYYVGDPTKKTVATSTGISLSGKLSSTNEDKQFYLNDLRKFRPALEFQVGYQRTVDTLFNFGLLSSTTDRFAAAWGVNMTFKVDNTLLYNKVTKTESQVKPTTIGILFHYTAYLAHWIIPSASIKYENSWNKTVLPQYQYNTPTFQDDKIIALDDVVGRIGSTDSIARINNVRLRISCPIIPFQDRFCVTPYYVLETGYNRQIYGLSLNILESKLLKGATKGINLAKAFGVGVDWEKRVDMPTTVKYFVYGSINITKLLSRKPVPET